MTTPKPMTDEEMASFENYAKENDTEADGTQSQWADYTIRLIADVRRLREREKQLEDKTACGNCEALFPTDEMRQVNGEKWCVSCDLVYVLNDRLRIAKEAIWRMEAERNELRQKVAHYVDGALCQTTI